MNAPGFPHRSSGIEPADLVWLRGLARALLRDEGRADDLVQDTVVAALGSRTLAGSPSGSPSGRVEVRSTRGWLKTVAQRMAQRQRRDELRRQDHERLAAKTGSAPSSADLAAAAEAAESVARVARGLEEPVRSTVLMRFLEGLSVREIAERSATKEDTVRWRLRRGLQLMRAELDTDQHGGEWALALLPLASLPSRAAALPSAGAAISIPVTVMSIKTLLLAAGVLALAGFFWTRGVPDDAPTEMGALEPAREPLVDAAASVPAQRGQELAPPAMGADRAGAPIPAPALDAALDDTAPSASVEFFGRVVGDRGQGIAGATVYLLDPQEREVKTALNHPRTVTNRRGEFRLEDLRAWFEGRPGEMRLHAVANGFVRSEGIAVTGDVTSRRIEIRLEQGLTIEGRVTDTDGQPVPGLPMMVHSPFVGDDSVTISRTVSSAAERNLSPPEGWPHHQCESATDAAGLVTFSGLSDGEYSVRSLDPSWEILEPRDARGADRGCDWVAVKRFSVNVLSKVRGSKPWKEGDVPFLDRPRLRANFRVKLWLRSGKKVDTGQWFGWGNGEVSFALTPELVPDQDLNEVVAARFYGTAELDGEEVEWRSKRVLRDPRPNSSRALSAEDVIVKFRGPAHRKSQAKRAPEASEQAATPVANVEVDVRYKGSGAPFTGELSIDWVHAPEVGPRQRGDSRGTRLPSGRFQIRVPVGAVALDVKDAFASGSLPSWKGRALVEPDGRTVVYAELDEGATVDVVRPTGWRGEWFVRASYRESTDEEWFGSWNYSTPGNTLRLGSLKPAEWRFQLRRSARGSYEETRIITLVPGDSLRVR